MERMEGVRYKQFSKLYEANRLKASPAQLAEMIGMLGDEKGTEFASMVAKRRDEINSNEIYPEVEKRLRNKRG